MSKTLTSAELACEHERAVADVYRAKVHGGDREQAIDRMLTVLRFIAKPAYDDPEEET